jgi:excinuclease ABC subunit B
MASLLYMTPEEAQKYSTRNTDDKNAINAYDDELNRGNYQLSDNNDVASLMIWPPSESFPLRVDMTRQHDGYRITSIGHGHSTGMTSVTSTTIFPAKHHIKGSQDQFDESLQRIQQELQTRVKDLIDSGKTVEANRLSHRVSQDLLLLRETGTCSGVENYSRHIALREEGEPPDTLLDYFGHITTSNGHRTKKQDWLLIVDESHVTLPQLKAMYGGDRSRKERLVKHGFRLPSALDNRPLRSEEFWRKIPQAVFVSATPARHELDLIAGTNEPIEMVIRPTFVCDPEITIRSTTDQLDDLLSEIRIRAKRHERTLAMTLTKRDAEDLASYLLDHGVSSTYIHSGMNTHERSEALKSLQHGEIDCLVGVNLLREGLDLPQVSFVAILNADSEGEFMG